MVLTYQTRTHGTRGTYKYFPPSMLSSSSSSIKHVDAPQTLTFRDLVEKVKNLTASLSKADDDNNIETEPVLQAIMVYSFLAQCANQQEIDKSISIRYE